ncbi:hypothetical protein [Flavobacterium sp.]|uniref:hypothetical protein n=1 Tax=Flavobacterium sp. TaxID=239 RepID=UPI003D6A22B9
MDQRIIEQKHGFAIFPSVKIMDYVVDKKGKKKFKWVKELLFGDWIGLYTDTQGQPIYEEIKGIQYLKDTAEIKMVL